MIKKCEIIAKSQGLLILFYKKAPVRMPSVLKDTRQFYSPFGEWYLLSQVILLRSGIAFGSLLANKIPLKPKVLITLLIYQKYHSVRSAEYHLKK